LPAFSMALRTHARAAAGKTRRATNLASAKIFHCTRITFSGIHRTIV
jgi:hypothetical protein